jgi:biopolymer transport protein ExbD
MARIDKVQEELKMDMTPMIDCVFLLMIFFVLVIDLSQQDLEDLILPKAEYAVPDDKPADVRPIVNLMQDGRVVHKGTVWYRPEVHGKNFTKLHDLMRYFKEFAIKDPELIKTEMIGGKPMTIIEAPLLIRADKWTEWHYVGKFMEGCVVPDAAFYKLELAMSEKDKEEALLRAQNR